MIKRGVERKKRAFDTIFRTCGILGRVMIPFGLKAPEDLIQPPSPGFRVSRISLCFFRIQVSVDILGRCV